jgi:hypothetical protein
LCIDKVITTIAYSSSAMKILVLTLASLMMPRLALGDSLPLKYGRYSGQVVVFKLTDQQKSVVDHYRVCQLEKPEMINRYIPYIFQLTNSQSKVLRQKVGFAPSLFKVYETIQGFNHSGLQWNLVLRHSNDQFEIPLKLLLTDKAAFAAYGEPAWKLYNPCFPEIPK